MKWFKHISDSLDDPFIFDLIDRFGGDGYLVFFGTLEIYAREFKPEKDWRLTMSRSYLKQKLHKRQDTKIIKCLQFIATHGKLPTNSEETPDKLVTNSRQTPDKLVKNLKKVYKNSGKWDITFDGELITVFIPKFTQLIDEWTSKKLRSKTGATPKNLRPETEQETEEELRTINSATDKSVVHFEQKIPEYADQIKIVCGRIENLPQKNGTKFNPYAFVQKSANDNLHPQAIIDILNSLVKNWDGVKKPWPYVSASVKSLSQNYNEKDHISQAKQFKQFIVKPDIQNLFIGKDMK